MYLKKLIGKSILKTSNEIGNAYPLNEKMNTNLENIKTEIYIQIVVEDYMLNIYNPFSITPNISIEAIEGKKIQSIDESINHITFFIESGIQLTIDLRDEVYQGPESLVLYGPNNLCVVWN